jgi:hypothetical protein
MAKVRIGRLELSQPATAPKVRWGRATLEGTAPSTPKVRVGRLELIGTISVVVNPIPDQVVEPETIVTVGPVSLASGTADSYAWRRISGPAITLVGAAGSNTRTFTAPSYQVSGTPASAVIVLGVTATLNSVTSAERTVTITVLTQTIWDYIGGSWVGAKPIMDL